MKLKIIFEILEITLKATKIIRNNANKICIEK